MVRVVLASALAVGLCMFAGVTSADDESGDAKPGDVDYKLDVEPILQKRCIRCHGGVKQNGGISLLQRDGALAVSESGKPAIVPGKPAESELVRRVRLARGDDDRMPPSGRPLGENEVETLARWIAAGAPYAEHWAYRRVERPAPPAVENETWARGDLDRFVLARLETEGLAPSSEAARRTLVQRVSLDLTGLPPTPAQVDAFVGDDDPHAYEALVDRLLASPHYGERWALLWLDLARYADTQGYEKDSRRSIWRYRDWVVRAFDEDMPYDRFTIEQLAGDLLPEPSTEQLIATAFHRNTMTNTEGGTDDEEFRVVAVMDRVNTTWQVWMGTTYGCVQCHSHPYDPFSHDEYYRFLAFLNDTEDHDQPDERPTIPTPTPAEEARRAQLAEEVREAKKAQEAPAPPDEGEEPPAENTETENPEERAELDKRITELEKKLHGFPVTTTPVMRELPPDKLRKTHRLERGSFLSPGEEVERGVPRSLHPFPEDAPVDRLGLARWIASRENPLTARVMVNRLWSELFGRGIVRTLEDFGTQGAEPTHPLLLDYLAVRFMEDHGWSVKQLLREIVLSATYRQSANASEMLLERDPTGRLLARGPRFRLGAEVIRDRALAVSGLLSEKKFGPSVMPPQPDGIWQVVYSGDNWSTSQGEDRHRRGLYTFWRRTSPYPSMVAFDAPSREFCTVRRLRTNTPLQALVTLNDPVYIEAAQALARRMVAEAGDAAAARVAHGFRLALGRQPSGEESERVLQLYLAELDHYRADGDAARRMATEPLGPAPDGVDVAELAAWSVVGNVILNLDEFLTKG